MISVLTITYQRSHLLEEAIESFLRQDFVGESEMIIVNDSSEVKYVYDHPKIKIYNVENRFSTIWHKLHYGFQVATYNHIYRLDDDDLLAPWALTNAWQDIVDNVDFEIYRSNGHYFFSNNKFQYISDNVNTGNIYTKSYIERIAEKMTDVQMGEDTTMTFKFNANTYLSKREKKTMIYRWGMGTYHISGMGVQDCNSMNKRTDELVSEIAEKNNGAREAGIIKLQPHFKHEYYSQIF